MKVSEKHSCVAVNWAYMTKFWILLAVGLVGVVSMRRIQGFHHAGQRQIHLAPKWIHDSPKPSASIKLIVPLWLGKKRYKTMCFSEWSEEEKKKKKSKRQLCRQGQWRKMAGSAPGARAEDALQHTENASTVKAEEDLGYYYLQLLQL